MGNKFSFSTLIASGCSVGFVQFAPGTLGSIIAFPIYLLFVFLLVTAKGGVSSISANEITNGMLVIITGLFFIGAWAADKYSKETNKPDPSEVVIDEIVAQMLVICLIIALLPFVGSDVIFKLKKLGYSENTIVLINLFSGFVLFRLFDITKPWPIDYIDKNYKHGIGIMMDDIIAAIFAIILHFFILYAVIDRI